MFGADRCVTRYPVPLSFPLDRDPLKRTPDVVIPVRRCSLKAKEYDVVRRFKVGNTEPKTRTRSRFSDFSRHRGGEVQELG